MEKILWGVNVPTQYTLTPSLLSIVTEIAVVVTCIVLIAWLIRHWN